MNDKSNQEVLKPDEKLLSTEMAAPTGEVTPMQAIVYAMEKGIPAEQMAMLMDLKNSHEDREAKKAFVRAMAAFKANPPKIIKDIQVSFPSKGGKTEYKHVDISTASDLIGEALLKHDLTHHWKTEPLDNGMTRVTCIITHVDGHSEESSMQAASDNSGGKNPIQAAGSTVSYLQRYTLLTAVGIVAQGIDNDGRGAAPEDAETISAADAERIKGKIKELEIDTKEFLKWAQAASVDDILQANLGKVDKALSDREKANNQGQGE